MQKQIITEPEWFNEKINLQSKVDIAFWCKMLECTENNLLKAIGIIGNSPKSVNSYLELNRLKEDKRYYE